MSPRGRLAATALVAADLAWVLQTGALSHSMAGALAALIGAAPLCGRLRSHRGWTSAWNLGLAAAFVALVGGVLVRGTGGLLGGGVLLAMACQVHLLHAGTGPRQADLLTFNSVLIALVAGQAGETAAGAGWLALWVGTLVLFLMTEAAPAPSGVQLTRPVGGALAAAVAAFGISVALPDDLMTQDPELAAALGWAGRTDLETPERIDLRSFRAPADEAAVMLRISLREGEPTAVPPHWRDAVLEHQDGSRFLARSRPGPRSPLGIDSAPAGPGRLTREAGPTAARVAVTIVGHRGSVLPAPLGFRDISVPLDGFPEQLRASGDGVLRRPTPAATPVDAKGYELGLGDTAPPTDPGDAADRAPYLRLDVEDPSAVPPVLHDLVRAALRGAPDDATPMEVVARCRAHLAAGFTYARPGEPGAATDFPSFLEAKGGGHCEYFATALTLMLRLRGIPCRIATGYLVHEWNAAESAFVVRARDAHAWVEVLDVDARRWRTVDPTPASSATPTPHRPPEALLLLAVASLAVAFALIRARRRRRSSRAQRSYERAVRRAGLERVPHETPRELLARAATDPRVRPARLEALRAATMDHERDRFRVPTNQGAC